MSPRKRGKGFTGSIGPEYPFLSLPTAMKCVKFIKGDFADRIMRVPDHQAGYNVRLGIAVYVSKKEWKEAGRP